MKFAVIPNIDSIWGNVNIKTLSPSTFSCVSRGCGYQVILQKAIQSFKERSLVLPPNRNAILGTIIHKIYELTLKGDLRNLTDLKNKWEELITAEKRRLAIDYPTLDNASINNYDKRNSAFRYALSILKKPSSTFFEGNGKKVLSEKKLDCTTIGLLGIADKLIIEDKYVDVIDFKSGLVEDENGGIKMEYIIQLHLYAAMCQHLSLGLPRNLFLIDIEGKKHMITYNPVFCQNLIYEVQDTIKRLNDAVSAEAFSEYAKPELGMCPLCSYRHICKYRDIPSDSYYQTVTGAIIGMPSTNMYIVYSGEKIFYISGLDAYNIDSPKDYIGKTLTFVNIAKASQIADDSTYKITENSLVYEQLL